MNFIKDFFMDIGRKLKNLLSTLCVIALVLILLIGALFVVFTFKTPQLPLFEDPITGTYGIQGVDLVICA